MRELSIIVVAGGKGLRMEATLPKQYLMLHVKPILAWTIEHVYKSIPSGVDAEIILVRPQADDQFVRELMATYLDTKDIHITFADGGANRADSVMSGLAQAKGAFVMVHDGVRPFVSPALFDKIWQARNAGAVVPIIQPIDSVRILDAEGVWRAQPRADVRLIQTPQLFERELLWHCYSDYFANPDASCTDDASIVEIYGGLAPTLVEGEEYNLKITTPKDLALATWYLTRK